MKEPDFLARDDRTRLLLAVYNQDGVINDI